MLLGNGVDPAEQGLVGACLCGDIAQVVGAAGGPTVGQEQLHAELFVQPAVEGPVPVGKGLLHGGGVGQQEIAVPAAAVEVTVQPLDEDRLGYYSAASRQIVLSRSVLESGTAQETMDTIAHEAFHVQQAYVVENIDWDDAATQAAYYDQARRWLRNYQNGYVSGEEDILSYYFQPVEVDARAYAAEETERLQGLIDKELQKET